MELKTRYQYTYFIYPYVIEENKYGKYIQKLLKDKRCDLRFFEREKDFEIYTHFLPNIRKYMFPTFSFTPNKRKKFNELDNEIKSTILQKYPCNVFEYNVKKDLQGKAGKENGIFFKIEKMEIICFQSGICFLTIKTHVENSEEFSDVLNFNYKFRDVKSKFISLKQFENIKIQADNFDDIQTFTDMIEEITSFYNKTDELNINSERFLTYSYTCLDQGSWNENKNFYDIEHEFCKYCNVLPSNYNIDLDKVNKNQDIQVIDKWKYIKAGFSKVGSCLLTSGIDTFNYTKLPFYYENIYLYTYILNLYKKMYLNKLKVEYAKNRQGEKMRKKFLKFTQELWIQEITNDDLGNLMSTKWERVLELEKSFLEVKNKYDLLYKEENIEKTAKTNHMILWILVISFIMNIINFVILFQSNG